jgi:hypothetical protein
MKWQEQERQALQNSSLLWMLKDTLKQRPDLQSDVDALLDKISPKEVRAIDAIHMSHRYPEKRITFNRLTRYNAYLEGLTSSAQAILLLMLQCSSQDNLVAISIPIISNICRCSDKTCKNAIKELISAQLIVLYRSASRHAPNVYLINPDLIAAGKPPSQSDREEFYNMCDKDTQSKTINPSYDVAYVLIKDLNGRSRSYGTLQEHQEDEESPKDAGSTNEANK